MTKEDFIGKYLTKHMANHNLSYGMAYFSLLAKMEGKAEIAWKQFLYRQKVKTKIHQ